MTDLSIWCTPGELLLPCGERERDFDFIGGVNVFPGGLLLREPFFVGIPKRTFL
jgi:hypothetical protein